MRHLAERELVDDEGNEDRDRQKQHVPEGVDSIPEEVDVRVVGGLEDCSHAGSDLLAVDLGENAVRPEYEDQEKQQVGHDRRVGRRHVA